MTPAEDRPVLVADHTGELARTIGQFSPVVTSADVAEVLRLARSARPAAAVVHGEIPPEGGVSTVMRLAPLAVPVVLAVARPDATVLTAALRCGVRSLLGTGAAPGRMLRAIEAAVRGDLFLAPELARELPALVDEEVVDRHPFPQLSVRERDVLAQLASGADVGRIARRLGVSTKTVRNQLARVQAKLGASDGEQAALMARGAGIGHRPPGR
jgi:DNA-binding NarL/FixJ family response regulator